MIQKFVDRFMERKDAIRARFTPVAPESYTAIITAVLEEISDYKKAEHDWEQRYDEFPDPKRIHEIDDGEYQGTLIYVIAEKGYQPDTYWYVKVGYGSCSGCDTLQAIPRHWDSDVPTEEELDDYMSLALHIIQGLKEMGEEEI